MRAVAPRTGAEEVTVAEDQLEYKPLTIARYDVQYDPGREPARCLLTRWRLDEAERKRVAEGEDIYLGCITFGDPLQPLLIQVGATAPTNWVQGEIDTTPAVIVGELPPNNIPSALSREEWLEAISTQLGVTDAERQNNAPVHIAAIALANLWLPADDAHKLSPAMVIGLRAVASSLMWPHSAFLFELADVISSYLPSPERP